MASSVGRDFFAFARPFTGVVFVDFGGERFCLAALSSSAVAWVPIRLRV